MKTLKTKDPAPRGTVSRFVAAVAAAIAPSPKARTIDEARQLVTSTRQQHLEAERRYERALERCKGREDSESAQRVIKEATEHRAAALQAAKDAAAQLAEFKRPATFEEKALQRRQPAHGVTPQIWKMIAIRVQPKVEQSKIADLRKLKAESIALMDKENEVVQKRPSQYHADHIAELGRKLDTGDMTLSQAEGFSNAEMKNEFEAILAAIKGRRKEKAWTAFALAVPMLKIAIEEAGHLVNEQVKFERARNEEFGLPAIEPSDVVRTVNYARVILMDRIVSFENREPSIGNGFDPIIWKLIEA